jgi:hypothetical protein
MVVVVLEIIHQIFRCRNRRWVEYKGIKLYIYFFVIGVYLFIFGLGLGYIVVGIFIG